ncbi:hypothetical protein FRACYDRAFT_255571 [Fragilariopsis cylindrus CCMP1102]|uniref:Uncharacterized protein n=1 Tax=Fragilariopsis cylindrus CCMP1102 TaxID=635003 RepID=A0A1E7EJY6_9STRA|nr:hypothetical protein FRACYDRAFT_255571 [Fragilariopsis cylindrus CCMP1102]|eukprot:OEU06225.1 hypothetical protein FRACYDRAFT_255571 [Fragilariopsis cylindrus CCMP1102]
MNDVNIGNNEDEQQQAEQEEARAAEQEVQQAAADTDAEDNDSADAKKQRHLQIMSVIGQKENFSFRTRNIMDILIKEFLHKVETDIHEMLCERIECEYGLNYHGLDSERDTESEVETTIRCFPDVLTRRRKLYVRDEQDYWNYYQEFDEDEDEKRAGDEYEEEDYPIQYLVCYRPVNDCFWDCNMKAISFVHLLARLAIEFGSFEEKDRGGLLCQTDYSNNGFLLQDDHNSHNVLQNLMNYNQEHNEAADNKYLQVLIQLRRMGLLKKKDIQRYRLLDKLCGRLILSEERFRFLVEWDPNALLQRNMRGNVPLKLAISNDCSIRRFQLVFEYGIRYFPKNKGINLLFRKNRSNYTPFQHACGKFDYDEVMNVIEDTLARYSDTPFYIAEALLSAAIDEKVHLDCVYFLVRREPGVLQRLIASTTVAERVKRRRMATNGD